MQASKRALWPAGMAATVLVFAGMSTEMFAGAGPVAAQAAGPARMSEVPPGRAEATSLPARPHTPRSGFDFMGRELQAMQRDDASNPGMLWVQEGLQLWSRPEGPQQQACAGCHGASPQVSMRDAAARHPAWDPASQRPVTLAGRIEQCRARHQGLGPSTPGASDAVLALETAVAHASRGLPVTPMVTPAVTSTAGGGIQTRLARGATLWQQRIGQLNLSCAQCHDERPGQRLGGALIPPGNAAGYPTYRLEWQAVGPLTRRLRNCMTGVRAEPYAPASDESLALQVYMAWRDRGLAVETPAVRP